MVLKVVVLAGLFAILVYVSWRAADWYFTKKKREDKLDALEKVRQMAEREAVWEDGNPETFDRERYERELEAAGVEVGFRERFLDALEEGQDPDLSLEDAP